MQKYLHLKVEKDGVYMHAKKSSETFSKTTGKEIRATHSVSNSSAFNEIFSLGTGLLLNK